MANSAYIKQQNKRQENSNRVPIICGTCCNINKTSSNGNIFRYWPFVRGIHRTVTGEFPAQRPVMRSFDVFFVLRLNKRLSDQSWGWLSETPSRSLWHHCNVGIEVWNVICQNWLCIRGRALHFAVSKIYTVHVYNLTHWDQNKMTDIMPMKCSNTFLERKWCLHSSYTIACAPKIQLTIF